MPTPMDVVLGTCMLPTASPALIKPDAVRCAAFLRLVLMLSGVIENNVVFDANVWFDLVQNDE